MYIIKNALKCISRSIGRNILIGIITLVIATSACIGLSIRQAAESAKETAKDGMSITASISYDRAGAMGKMSEKVKSGSGGTSSGSSKDSSKGGGFDMGSFDRSMFSGFMNDTSSLTLEEYQTYASADSVSDFYYTLTAYVDGSDDFLPVSDEEEEEETSKSSNNPFGNTGGMSNMFGGTSNGDFTVIGYSSDSAMTSFINGTVSVLDGGAMFEEGTTDLDCVISEELALYNSLSVGDTVIITNPSSEEETYTLTVTGIYESTETNDFSMSAFGKSQDPANSIYMSANALQSILDSSAEASTTVTDETTGRETSTEMTGTLSATYCFDDVDAYETFEEQARALGLSDDYVISSNDITEYENSLTPLNTLSTMAKWFLVIILIIGGVILIVLNIFNVRERKYEVGVLTAMGMKKRKVAAQFMCEIFVVTMLAVIVGAGVGAVSSVPVTNALLESQVESQSNKQTEVDQSFGRAGNMGGNMGGGFGGNMGGDTPSDIPEMPSGASDMAENNPFEKVMNSAGNYISEVDSAMNLTVVFQMIGVGLLLTLVASAASVLFIMRYDPLKILANRD